MKKKPKKKNKKKVDKRKSVPLTAKQTMFCKEYLVDLNSTQAAIRAGYSKKTACEQGSRLLANVKVRARVEKGMEKRSEKVEITADYVLGNLKEIGERCMQRIPVIVKDGKGWKQKTEINKEGKEAGVWEFQAMGAIKANELLGKHIKLFTEKVEEKITEKKIFITQKEQADTDEHIDKSLGT